MGYVVYGKWASMGLMLCLQDKVMLFPLCTMSAKSAVHTRAEEQLHPQHQLAYHVTRSWLIMTLEYRAVLDLEAEGQTGESSPPAPASRHALFVPVSA